MLLKPNPASGLPIYLQLMEQVKHSIATGALRPGDQLPGIRRIAEDLVINPNTVAKALRELEHEGVLEVRHGAGAFVAEHKQDGRHSQRTARAIEIIREAISRLEKLGLVADEIRRLFEGELMQHSPAGKERYR